MCRYCDPNSQELEMCVDCRRRYNRLSLNRSKLVKQGSKADYAKILSKVLDDLDQYRDLQSKGCVVQPVVAAALREFEHVDRPGLVCAYCGEVVTAFRKPTRMCGDCFKFYNYFNQLYNGPKRPGAVVTRQRYRESLVDIADRQSRGLRIPGTALAALKEDRHMIERRS